MLTLMVITKALADESRVRVLFALQGRELCVCQIIELLGLAPSTVSKHMFILKQAGLVEARKDGRWMHYRLAGKEAPKEIRDAIAWVCRSVAASYNISEDAKRLRKILKLDPEKLCRVQNNR